MPRNSFIDSFRGLLFFPMLFFHIVIFYDLKYNTNNNKLPFVSALGNVRTLYIILAGASLFLHKQKHKTKSFKKKLVNKKMLIAIFAMTTISHYLYPEQGIKFGILHFIYLASLIVCGIDDKMLLYLSLLLYAVKYFKLNTQSTILGPVPIHNTLDWFPLLSNLSLFIMGYHAGKTLHKYYDKLPNIENKTLSYIGKHSLEFYVGHFVILMVLAKV